MKYVDPRHVVSLTADAEKFSFYIKMQRKVIDQTLAHIAQVYPYTPNLNQRILAEVHDYLRETLGISVSEGHLAAMFLLYPVDAVAIVDLSAAEPRDNLMDMISHYYVNSYWPGADDGVDDEDWEEVIRQAFTHMQRR